MSTIDTMIEKKPRRRVMFIAKIEADNWRDLKGHLMMLATDIAARGSLSKQSISGGYSSGHIIVTSEDDAIDHDSWAADLDAHLEALKEDIGTPPICTTSSALEDSQ